MLVEVHEYGGIIDWFKDLVGVAVKPKATKNTGGIKNTEHKNDNIKNLLLFGGLVIAAFVLLSSAEGKKKQALGG